jgi:NADH-quinone oxidoreductase subunit N
MGIFHLYQTTHTFEYSQIGNILAADAFVASPWVKIDILLLMASFLFLLALVPFHNWFIALEANTVLPVCGVFTLIPPLVYICALFNLVSGAFFSYQDFIRPLLEVFATLSLIIGSLSANKEPNIRRLLACVAISCFGCAVLCLSDFSQTAVMAAFAYMISAEIALAGIYTVLLGFKSKGEYLHELSALSGFYQVRPYLAALLLIFIFSLTGLAPTIGFFGNVSVLSNFITHREGLQIGLILLSQLLMISAFLPMIQALYFNPLQDKFDRTDKAIYLCLGFNLALMITALLNPSGLINDALLMMKGIF